MTQNISLFLLTLCDNDFLNERSKGVVKRTFGDLHRSCILRSRWEWLALLGEKRIKNDREERNEKGVGCGECVEGGGLRLGPRQGGERREGKGPVSSKPWTLTGHDQGKSTARVPRRVSLRCGLRTSACDVSSIRHRANGLWGSICMPAHCNVWKPSTLAASAGQKEPLCHLPHVQGPLSRCEGDSTLSLALASLTVGKASLSWEAYQGSERSPVGAWPCHHLISWSGS